MVVPLKSKSLAKVLMEFEQEVLLVLRAQVEHLLAGDDGSDASQRLVGILVWAPFNAHDFTTHDERVMDSVTS